MNLKLVSAKITPWPKSHSKMMLDPLHLSKKKTLLENLQLTYLSLNIHIIYVYMHISIYLIHLLSYILLNQNIYTYIYF